VDVAEFPCADGFCLDIEHRLRLAARFEKPPVGTTVSQQLDPLDKAFAASAVCSTRRFMGSPQQVICPDPLSSTSTTIPHTVHL